MAGDANITNPFQPSVKSYILGSSIALFSVPGWLANALIVIIISYGGLLSNGGTVYTLMASLAVGDFITLSLLIFYLAPSSALQTWLLPNGLESLPGDLLLVCWYHMWFMLSLIGINRYVAICHLDRYETLFTKGRTRFLVLASWIGAALVWSHFLWMPCCRFYISFVVYSFMWDPKSTTETNVGDIFIEYPGNVGTTLILAFCYSKVIYKVYKSGRKVAVSVVRTRQKEKKVNEGQQRLEKSLAIQFLVISLVYTTLWVMFRLCPLIIGTTMLEAYVVVAYLVIANCTVNPFLYLKYATDIKQKLSELRGKNNDQTGARKGQKGITRGPTSIKTNRHAMSVVSRKQMSNKIEEIQPAEEDQQF